MWDVEVGLSATNEELEVKLKQLTTDFQNYKKEQNIQNNTLIDEILNSQNGFDNKGHSHKGISSLGLSASKVYRSSSGISIGGYGTYKYKKYTDFKNYKNSADNQTRRKSETNVVRFIPYFGYRFNDWIVMNTEIEFENGGARSDGTKNYKYAIVEFSYLDFLFDSKYNLRVGHILVPMGNINLNHEPTSFLTTERPLVETYIIPSTWHTNGALVYGYYKGIDYHVGIVTSPDAGKFTQGRFIQQGRLGARQFTDDISFVTRANHTIKSWLTIGGSFYYGNSSALLQEKPGGVVNSTKSDITITMTELHVDYKMHGFDIKALAVFGSLGGEYKKLNSDKHSISGDVNGQYLTVGYDLFRQHKTTHKLYGVLDIERLDLDANNETAFPENYKFIEYSMGLAYFPDPQVVIKAEFANKNYSSSATLADESFFTATVGFIF